MSWHIIKKNRAFFSPVVLFFSLGYLSIQPWLAPDFPSTHVVHFADTHPWKVVGVIESPPAQSKNRIRCIIRAETLSDNTTSFPVTGKVRVTVWGTDQPLSFGDRITFVSKIRSVRNFNNPGGFDYERYMGFKDVWVTAYVSQTRLYILNKHTRKGMRQFVENVRAKIAVLIETTAQKDQENQRAVLKALIIGDRHCISKQLREVFNRAGIGHLLAISGIHMGIVATVSFMVFSWILSRFRFFLWYAWTRKGAALLSIIPVLVYGLLAGMPPSTQRAVIMVTLFLMTFIIEKEHDLVNTLAIAAMLILIVSPPSIFSISFQLSFSAVLAILCGMPLINGKRRMSKTIGKRTWPFQIIKKLFSFFMVSFFAILGTLPLVMVYFNQVSLVGLFANLIMIPVIGFVVVPIGLFSVFLYPLSIEAASVCIKASGTVLAAALQIIDFFADLPFAAIKTITPSGLEICCFYILAWTVLSVLKARQKTGDTAGPGHKKGAIVILVVLLICCVDAFYWVHKRILHDDLRVTIIDVGQGSSALLEMPGGACFLIDGGGFSDNAVFDVGERIIAPLLWRKKIKTVDTLILSHPNSDHLNGFLYIAKHFNVKSVWTNNEEVDTWGYREFIKIIKKEKIIMPQLKNISGTHYINGDINGVHLNVMYPPEGFRDRKEKWRDPNNNSLVVKVRFGLTSFLFTGDIMAMAEKELVATKGDALNSMVLIAPHHGSKTSSSAVFLDTVKPKFAIISSGWKNRFRFPHPDVLKRFQKRDVRIFRTDRNGAVTISTDGQSLKIKTTI